MTEADPFCERANEGISPALWIPAFAGMTVEGSVSKRRRALVEIIDTGMCAPAQGRLIGPFRAAAGWSRRVFKRG